MSTVSCTISGVSVSILNGSIAIVNMLENRSTLRFTVLDSPGTANYTRGQPVVLTDSVRGVLYSGFVQSSSPLKDGLSLPFVEHAITCMDTQYLLDKRTNSTNYLEWYAGNIITNFIDSTLGAEGVTAPYGSHADVTAANFNQGILTGEMGATNTNAPNTANGDEQLVVAGTTVASDLELLSAGSTVTIAENTTANFATGTLTNMAATSNTLVPTTVNALKLQSTLSFAYGVEFAQSQQTASGTASGTATGTASGTVSPSGTFTPSGTISISGGNPGEFASFFGSGGTVNTSGSFSASVSSPFTASVGVNVSQPYTPKFKSKVKVDATHYDVVSVDQAVADNRIDATIWTGSQVIGTSDTLNYDIWISSSSPSEEGGVELFFSDGTQMTSYMGTLHTNTDVGVWDQNFVSISPIQDLSDYAKDCWYTRNIDLTILVGKTVTSVSVFNAANLAGTFDIYVKNCYLGSHSGSPYFSTSATVPAVNPPTISSIGAYVDSATIVTVQAVYLPVASTRVSAAYSIDAVKLVKSSLISWVAANPIIGPAVVVGSPGAATVAGSEAIFVSYDNTTWLLCVNNQPLPGLPAGANVAGLSLYIKEQFTGGQDPTAIPQLQSIKITITSAPNATTSDVVANYGNTTEWNSGTLQGVAPNSNGDLILGSTSYSWATLGNMTFIGGYLVDTDVVLPVQSVSSGAYILTSVGDSDGDSWSSTRFNFISAAKDFTVQADFTLSGTSPLQNEVGFVYRQTFWGSPNNSFAYYIRIMQNPGGGAGGTSVTLGYGTNSPPALGTSIYSSGTFTVLQQVTETITSGTAYHVKVVVGGNRHKIYWNNGGTPIIDILDDTYTQAGNVGVRTYINAGSTNTMTAKIANFTITNTFAGLWTSPSMSLSALGTCGNTQVAWSEVNPAGDIQANALVMASLDGGSTWQQCTNGMLNPLITIPGLPNGTSVTGKSLLLQVVLSSTAFLLAPIIQGLNVRVCGQYPGSSGTRSTVPLVNDTMIRANQSGAGTAFDGQAYTKVGTATDAISSNELTITNTTGDVHEVVGSRVWGDVDGTVRFSLDSSADNAGMELRYVNSSNYYRLAISTTYTYISKVVGGSATVLAIIANPLSINTKYRMRLRIVGNSPVSFFANVWADGTLEPTINPITGLWNNNNWLLVASD